ncbi:MAG: 5-methyltetrahydropteroyltriglutamate--homocysteine S-methyltransferase [Clostridiales bacterium]|nr:5-methyltetrahydropteroyltriglutamate--homocysteine S-methyltransferase [Clostridiales bacterium]
MKTAVIGYPRIGSLRELKFASEKYFKGAVSADELRETAAYIRAANLNAQAAAGIDFIPSNDFSFYDNLLDSAVLLNIIPERYRELNVSPLDTYFAMARGYQGEAGNVKALAMKKWFNTNCHYIVPEIDDETELKLNDTKPFDEFTEAKNLGIKTVPALIGAFTLLKLSRYTGKKTEKDFAADAAKVYSEIIEKLADLGAEYISISEPCLVKDLTKEEISLFEEIYKTVLASKKGVKIILQTYFGDIRDCYNEVCALDFDGIGLDFIEGKESLNLVKKNGFPKDKALFAGVVNGKNIWKNDYSKTVKTVKELQSLGAEVVLNTSCSLLHVPYTLKNETKLTEEYTRHFAFAEEKLQELGELKTVLSSENYEATAEFKANKAVFADDRKALDTAVKERVAAIKDSDFTRQPAFAEREKIQKERFNLPLFPTTTIGSFPQTADVRANRTARRKGNITEEEYKNFNKEKIAECIKLQEEIGLDVLVHGEYERNDMVEYFGEKLKGFLFTEKAWVQSYGTRCVKPPIVWGDVSREAPITVEWSVFAQSQTDHLMKGMLTGPVTILNWSFPREDISLKECAYQIALAIRDEVLDLEANGIKIIQVDEAALREKLPLRKTDWESDYLDWAIPAFRLVHSGVKPETQIHTHMCYSEFTDIIKAIDNMDADVITFEASRSDLQILDSLKENNFRTEVGPGVYDIHSPRVPSVEEIVSALNKMTEKTEVSKLWVNPDCGLKTRGTEETVPSLKNLVAAAKELRSKY